MFAQLAAPRPGVVSAAMIEPRAIAGRATLGRPLAAYRFRAEGHCTAWHIEDAYDTLVQVEGSDWVSELLAAEPIGSRGHWKIRHFLICIDRSGAYEVAAEDVEWLSEEPSS